MYFTDRGIEELEDQRATNRSPFLLAGRLRDFVDLNPEFETAVDRLATWLAGSTRTTDRIIAGAGPGIVASADAACSAGETPIVTNTRQDIS